MSISMKSTKSEILVAYDLLQAQVAQLERNANDDLRRIGVMMYDANLLSQRVVELEAEIAILEDGCEILKDSYDDVEQQLIAAEAQVKRQGQVIAAQPKTAPPRNPKPAPKPLPATVELSPVVQINDFDRAMYRKFQALPREQRLEIIAFARPIVGHVGIHNIVTVRAAWHESQSAVA